jgi:hypothetical protein
MMSQITSQGASDFSPSGLTWLLEIWYPAFITAERNITADGDVHLTVPDMLWRLKNNGKSCNSCITRKHGWRLKSVHNNSSIVDNFSATMHVSTGHSNQMLS